MRLVELVGAEEAAGRWTPTRPTRGLDSLWGMHQWLDGAPLGRNETGFWYRRHDEYDSQRNHGYVKEEDDYE